MTGGEGRQSGHPRLGDAALGVENRRALPARRGGGGGGSSGRRVDTGGGAAVEGAGTRERAQAERVGRIAQGDRAHTGQGGGEPATAQGRLRHHGRLHPKARVGAMRHGGGRAVRGGGGGRAVRFRQGFGQKTVRTQHAALLVLVGAVFQPVSGGAAQAGGPDHIKTLAPGPFGARQGLAAARRVGVFDQPPQGVVGQLEGIALGIGKPGQQPVSGVGHPVGVARRVGDAGQIAVAVHAQRGALAEGGDQRRGLASAVAFDSDDVAVAVGDAAQPAGTVVAEGVQHRLGQRIHRAKVATVGVEMIQVAAVGSGDSEILVALQSG